MERSAAGGEPACGAAALGWAHLLADAGDLAVAAAVVLAVGVPMVIHHDRPPVDTTTIDSQDDSDAQIAEDNQLMRSVNTAIGANDVSPLREYGLQTGRRPRLKRVSGLRSE